MVAGRWQGDTDETETESCCASCGRGGGGAMGSATDEGMDEGMMMQGGCCRCDGDNVTRASLVRDETRGKLVVERRRREVEEKWRQRHGNLNGDGRDADADGKGMCDVTWERPCLQRKGEGRRGCEACEQGKLNGRRRARRRCDC